MQLKVFLDGILAGEGEISKVSFLLHLGLFVKALQAQQEHQHGKKKRQCFHL